MTYPMQSKDQLVEPLLLLLWNCARSLIPTSGVKGKLDQTIRNATSGVMDEKGNKRFAKVAKAQATDYGYKFTLHLPAGLCLADILKAQEEINFALNADCQIYEDNGRVYIKAYTGHVPSKFNYNSQLVKRIAKRELALPIGISRAGFETVDMTRYNHLLIGGLSNSGKSVLLRVMITALHEAYTPEHVGLYLVDLKNGNEFKLFRGSKFVMDWAGDYDSALRVLNKLNKELDRRTNILDKTPYVNTQEYNQFSGKKMPYCLLFIDEFAEFDKPHKALVDRLARMGRFVGIHCVICTQRPDRDTVPGCIKANLSATIAFKCRNSINSEILLDRGNGQAAMLTPVPGRAIYQGANTREVQVMWLSAQKALKILSKYRGMHPDAHPSVEPLT